MNKSSEDDIVASLQRQQIILENKLKSVEQQITLNKELSLIYKNENYKEEVKLKGLLENNPLNIEVNSIWPNINNDTIVLDKIKQDNKQPDFNFHFKAIANYKHLQINDSIVQNKTKEFIV